MSCREPKSHPICLVLTTTSSLRTPQLLRMVNTVNHRAVRALLVHRTKSEGCSKKSLICKIKSKQRSSNVTYAKKSMNNF